MENQNSENDIHLWISSPVYINITEIVRGMFGYVRHTMEVVTFDPTAAVAGCVFVCHQHLQQMLKTMKNAHEKVQKYGEKVVPSFCCEF